MSSADLEENVNRGSEVLMPLTKLAGLRIDEVNFLFCKISAIFLAFWFRNFLNRSVASSTTRHLFVTLFGFFIIAFCFGFSDLLSLISFSLAIFACIRIFPKYCYEMSFVLSFGVLSWHHLNLLLYKNIDNYTLDVTATVMIMVQKFTSLAASVNDGTKSKAELEKVGGKTRIEQAIHFSKAEKNLQLLPFLSYIFNFMGILAGPHNYFNDYKEFIENDGDRKQAKNVKLWEDSKYRHNYLVVAKKAIIGWVCLGLSLWGNSIFNVNLLGKPEFIEKTGKFGLFVHFFVAGCLVGRYKFYFAWLYSEAINNAAGFGYDREKENWNLISNVDFFGVELAYSSKHAINNWNTQSVSWLRLIVYERLPKSTPSLVKTAAVFTMSSIWHGFYPAYYWFFSYGILITAANRKLANSISHYMQQQNYVIRTIHRYVGMLGFHITFNYISVSHLLLTFERCKVFYGSVWCFGHVLLVLIMLLPFEKVFGRKPRGEKAKSS